MKSSIGLIFILAGFAQAGVIVLQSGASAGESNNMTGTNVVLSDVNPNWAPDQDGASWVSYEDTGYSASDADYSPNPLVNSTNVNSPNAEFFQTFTDNVSLLSLTLTVWGDDTALVLLDGTQISPNVTFTQMSGMECAPSGITCSGPGTIITVNDIAAGTHTLQFNVYQTGGGTYGVMYEGTVNDLSSAPEPGTCVLMGAGLAAVALFRQKRIF
jgi:hypothetical protein